MTTLLPIGLGLLAQSTALLAQSTALLGLGLTAMRLARRHGPAVQSLLGRATLAGVGLALLLAGPLAGHVRPVWHVTLPVPSMPQAFNPKEEPTPLQVRSEEPTPLQAASPPAPARKASAAGTTGRERGKTVVKFRLNGASLTEQPRDDPNRLSNDLPSPPSPLGRVAARGGVGFLALAAAWAAGSTLLLLWLALCQCHLTRLRRQASPVTAGPAAEMLAALTTRPPLLLTHPSVRSPFLAGLRRPAIFLPTAYEIEFDPTALRAILAHELAHLARRDNAWTLAARLLTALLWPQPLLWALCRRLEQCGEEACDLAVLAQDCPPRAYAECLLTLAERHPLGRRERALGVGVAPFRSSLGRRIGRILDKGTHAMSAITLRLRLTVAALAVAAALGGAFLVSSAPAQSPVSVAVTPTPEQQRFNAMRIQDAMNLKQIGLALTQYLQDHDEHFPSAARWMEALSPYLKDKTVFFDPFQPGARRYGYAFNRNCSGKSLAFFDYPSAEVMAFDSTLGTRDASDTGQSVRYTARNGDRYSSILFVDAHVKWMRASYLPSFAIQHSAHPSYRPRQRAGLPQPNALARAHLQQFRALTAALSASHPDPELSNARFLAGLTPVQGPGVVVTLRDSRRSLPVMPGGFAPPNIIHDSDINQVVNELKAAGAEAIAVNDQRLVATSSVRTAGATVLINFVPTAPPYVIKAIGDPKTLASAMYLPGGVASQIKAFDPAMFSVQESGMLTLPAYSGRSEPRYAKPMPAGSLADAQQRTIEALQSRLLIQKRQQLEAQLAALNAQVAALTAYTQALRAQGARSIQWAAPSPPHGTSAHSQADPERQAIASQLAAAQTDLVQKEATMVPLSPGVIAAKRKVQMLEKMYAERAIREKQKFVEEVHRYDRQQVVAIAALANAEDPAAHQRNTLQKQQRQLQAAIASVDAQIAHHKTPTSGR